MYALADKEAIQTKILETTDFPPRVATIANQLSQDDRSKDLSAVSKKISKENLTS